MTGSRVATPLHQHARIRDAHGGRDTYQQGGEDEAGTEPSVDELLAFERLLVDLSSQFANVAGGEFETATEAALLRIREFLGFDRCSFYEFLEDGSRDVLSSSAVNGVDPLPLGTFRPELPWYHHKLLAGEMVIHQSLPDDLPAEAVAEAAYVRSKNLRAQVSIPLSISGRIVGMIGLAAFRETRHWPVDLIARIKLIGEMIAQALARKRADEKLMAALTEVEALRIASSRRMPICGRLLR